jgi:hypothetical protein
VTKAATVRARARLGGKASYGHAKKPAFAGEVTQAFDELATRDGRLIAHFEEAFKERAQDPSLSEAKGELEGLTLVLSGLLSRIPPEDDFKFPAWGPPVVSHNPSFSKNFHTAVQNLEDRHPEVFELLKRHQLEQGVSLRRFLRALFGLYCRNKRVYPY